MNRLTSIRSKSMWLASVFMVVFLLFAWMATGLAQENTVDRYAISQELPELMDLAQLKLEVTNTEVVGQISGYNTTLSAKEGFKLFVVTLIGIVTEPCKIAIETREFSAIYEKEITNNKGEKETSLDVIVSDAVATGDSWSIPPVGARTFTVCPIKAGPTIIKVAFILPEKITSFFVRYPALAKGKATISAQAGE